MTNLSLPVAVDALSRAARQGSRPSSLWLVGLVYQGLSLGWTFGITVARPIATAVLPESLAVALAELGPQRWLSRLFDPIHYWRQIDGAGRWLSLVLLLPILLLPFRLVAGMARLAPPEVRASQRAEGRRLGLGSAWGAGRGFARSALGLWTQVLWMMFLAALFFLGPCHLLLSTLALAENNPLLALLYGLALCLIGIYGFVLTVLFQLALHSLVQNRRGVGSALLHAWRIVRSDPWAAARATLLDALLYAAVVAVQMGLFLVMGLAENLAALAGVRMAALCVSLPGLLVILALEAFAGCTRCVFWADAYRALGGIATISNRQLE